MYFVYSQVKPTTGYCLVESLTLFKRLLVEFFLSLLHFSGT